MNRWTFEESRIASGRFRISATGWGPDGANVDITTVRGVPTLISSYSSADPFGDAAAVLHFGGLTPFDDLHSTELRRWLMNFADIDIYWSPSIPATSSTAPEDRTIDPFTNQPTVQNPYTGAIKVWEGYIASFDFSDDAIEVQCQGAVFQLDRYQARPFFPARPWPIERLIADQFDHTNRPNLRTKPLQMIWPDTWKRVAPVYTGTSPMVYAPVINPGDNWTEYVSRSTGGFDAALTSFIQNLLTSMITRPGDGDEVVPGDQWTIGKATGRQPQMYVRARNRPADFSVWVGTPGVTVSLSSDSTQAGNVIYGRGTDLHGVVWNNGQVSNDGTRTVYAPLAAEVSVYPLQDNPLLVPGAFVTEVSTSFETGFSQEQATELAQQWLARDRDSGFTGSITLSTDPSSSLSRWQVRAGMTMVLQGFLGSGERGIRLHISAVTVSPEAGTVDLTVDTRYRDLLTVQESINRTRDPLTPIKMLQVNKTSVVLDDIQSPWSYNAGAGCCPIKSLGFHNLIPSTANFPYETYTKKYPPISYPDFYIKCTPNAAKPEDRWVHWYDEVGGGDGVPILTSTKGTISRTEFAVYDKLGNVVPQAMYHVSIYTVDPLVDQDMPQAANGDITPFINNAFETNDPTTGQPWPPGSHLGPSPNLIIGWGSVTNGTSNRCGFSPGSEADNGQNPTGLLIDNLTWQYDSTNNTEYQPDLPANAPQSPGALNVYAMFYAENYTEPVYFMGRLFHQNAGSDSQ